MAREKILLVDDDTEFTEILSERMEAKGLAVDTAENGQTALKKIQEASYDAIILDLAMPGMDGIETLKLLLKKQPDLQVILLTGHATVQKGVEAIKLGAMDFIEKPADLQKLLEKIKEAKTQKMLLTQKKIQAELTRILQEKGW